VPCGGPGEPECDLCFFFEMLKRVVDFSLLNVAAPLLALLLAYGGYALLVSRDEPERVNKAKSVIKSSVMGLVIIFSGWIIVNTFMAAIGVEEWTGLREGWWKIKVACALPEPPLPPVPPVCAASANIPGWENLGMGCYLDENNNGKVDASECKKGKYICDPEGNDGQGAVFCANVFGDPKYLDPKYQTLEYEPARDYTGRSNWFITDYCCANMMSEYADGMIADKPFTIVRATPADVHLTGGATLFQAWLGGPLDLDVGQPYGAGGLRGGFNCDEICKKYGRICVGVGLTDPSKNACVYEVHDEPSVAADAARCNNSGQPVISMRLSGNMAYNNCKAYFGFIYYSHNNERWSTGYDKYEYYCTKYDPRSYHVFGPALGKANMNGINNVPDGSCGVCKPKAANGGSCSGHDYAQDPTDSCAFHGNDLGETACYCY